jgi:hypothetical protein
VNEEVPAYGLWPLVIINALVFISARYTAATPAFFPRRPPTAPAPQH